jgi:hypothetical protein
MHKTQKYFVMKNARNLYIWKPQQTRKGIEVLPKDRIVSEFTIKDIIFLVWPTHSFFLLVGFEYGTKKGLVIICSTELGKLLDGSVQGNPNRLL